jgi:replicative DNA helicase
MTAGLPRHDLDAEAAVLSAALLSTDASLELVELLEPADFYADANRRVYDAIRAIAARGEPVDIVGVANELRATNRLAQVGGTPYLAQLADATPAIAHLDRHAAIVRGWARVRTAQATFALLNAEARTAEMPDVDAWLESCEQRAYAATATRGDTIEGPTSYAELVPSAFEKLRDASPAALGMPTGFHELDAHAHGLSPGDLWFVAARPGQGKTAWVQQLAEQIGFADPTAGTVMLSMEIDRESMTFRALARWSRLPMNAIKSRQLDRDGWHRLAQAASDLVKLPIKVGEAEHLTPLKLRRKVRRLDAELRAEKPGTRLALVVVDYVQLMSGDDVAKGTNRAVELGQISRSLKMLAKELKCTVVVCSQLARKQRGAAKRPELDELRDSGALEADADLVLALHREDEYRKPGSEPSGKCEVLILKGRNCGTNFHELAFNGPSSRFDNLGKQQEYAWQ